jgi:hypothetical protein
VTFPSPDGKGVIRVFTRNIFVSEAIARDFVEALPKNPHEELICCVAKHQDLTYHGKPRTIHRQ